MLKPPPDVTWDDLMMVHASPAERSALKATRRVFPDAVPLSRDEVFKAMVAGGMFAGTAATYAGRVMKLVRLVYSRRLAGTLPAHRAGRGLCLEEQISECLASMSRWPDLWTYMIPGLIEAQRKASVVKRPAKGEEE